MKNLRTKLSYTLYFVLVAVLMNGCEVGITKNGVKQHLDKECRGLVKSGTALATYVWYDGEIAKSWYDDINTINDSLICVRKKQAAELLDALENCN